MAKILKIITARALRHLSYWICYYLCCMKRLNLHPHASSIVVSIVIRKWQQMRNLLTTLLRRNMSWRSNEIPLWYFVFILHNFDQTQQSKGEKSAFTPFNFRLEPHRYGRFLSLTFYNKCDDDDDDTCLITKL